MAVVNLNATPRTNSGKGGARKIRQTGQIPAVIYRGGEPATSITIDPRALELQFQQTKNRNTLVDVAVDGGTHRCLVRSVQRHPVSGVLRHVDFYEVQPEQHIVVQVPLEPVGRALGTRLGGKLRVIRRDLSVRCKPADIPATVQVDVNPVNVGEFIRVADIPAPENTELIYAVNFNVITVVGKRGAGPAGESA